MRKVSAIVLFILLSVTHICGQDLIKYQVAQYPEGKKELAKIVGKNMRLSKKLFETMVKDGISEVTVVIGIIIDSKGKFVAVDVLQASHPLMDEKSFTRLEKALKDKTFIPGTINGEPAATSIIIDDLMARIGAPRTL